MATFPRIQLPAADRPAPDWDDPRRAVTHAMNAGARLGWTATLDILAVPALRMRPELRHLRGVGDAFVVTYRRGNGSVAETVVAAFRIPAAGRGPVHFLRFAGGVDADGEPALTWARTMVELYTEPVKARRAPRGTRQRSRRGQ